MSGPLWEQLLLLKRLRGNVLHGGPCRGAGSGGRGQPGSRGLDWDQAGFHLFTIPSPPFSSSSPATSPLSRHSGLDNSFHATPLPSPPPQGCIDLLSPHNIISLCFSSAPPPSAVLTPHLLQTSRSTPLGVLLPSPDQDTKGLGPPESTLCPTGSAQVTGRM